MAYASWSMTETGQRYAQVEKETLALTWGCERFRDFLISRHFSLETDHKPLVSLLGHQALTELSSRIQRFMLRRYSYSILHTPGKALFTADTLSRAPVSLNISLKDTDKSLMEDTNIYVDEIMNGISSGQLGRRVRGLAERDFGGRQREPHRPTAPAFISIGYTVP